VLLTEDGSAPSNLFQVSLAADQHLKVLYNARPEEPCARAFEAFIKDSQPRNRFLVSETVHSDEAKAGLYPHGDHRQRINHAFQCYFAALGAALYREQAKAGRGGPYLSWWTAITSMHPTRSCSDRIRPK